MIHRLPESLSSRIAAGEVVERPVSVVKELLENALDAGARRIDVRLLQGGKASITVEDDGGGIPFEELPLAVERYATSKLSSLEDLYAIRTLGYRGEALASIALVSRLEIRSCPPGEKGGRIRLEEGACLDHQQIPCPEGTAIDVDDLFCSIPARKKFLKSEAAETRRISRLLRDYALAYPDVAFVLFSDGKKLFSSLRRRRPLGASRPSLGRWSNRRVPGGDGGICRGGLPSFPGTYGKGTSGLFRERPPL